MNQAEKINLIAILFDIQEQYLMQLAPTYRQYMKRLCNDSLKSIKKLIKEFDEIHTEENQIKFGDTSDELRKMIEQWIKQ